MVECDLAKVEVAGSNPVSRSRFLFRPVVAATLPVWPRSSQQRVDNFRAGRYLNVPKGAVPKW